MRHHYLLLIALLLGSIHGGTAFSAFKFPWEGGGFSPSGSGSAKDYVEIKEQQILLENGVSAQVLSALPRKTTSKKKPPLVFLHGSFHGAWCWTEKMFPYFVSLGYPVVAFSWRGTGGTPAGEGVKKVKVAEHCEDLDGFLKQIPSLLGKGYEKTKPVLLSHSFGGIVVMKYLEGCGANDKQPSDLFSAIITMCSVPPSGNGKMTMRFLGRSLVDSYKITVGFAMKKSISDSTLCRQLFFGGEPRVLVDGTTDDYGVSDADIARYQEYFARDTDATIDLLDLAKVLPSSKVDENGRAPFVLDLPPSLVIGAKDDFIVDPEGNMETSRYYGLEGPVWVDSPHDVMLGGKWQNCADTIHNWIEEKVVN
jgi:pimeloyl-ACP methyl ester carboxylesterase